VPDCADEEKPSDEAAAHLGMAGLVAASCSSAPTAPASSWPDDATAVHDMRVACPSRRARRTRSEELAVRMGALLAFWLSHEYLTLDLRTHPPTPRVAPG